ncbi:Lysosomal Pro-X carboxypeptidase [Galemys pyrenaicus]|uniref:Lysosomal Pro-X carboxypeptidase n=1 Tax=Galemys pyrenaicus TaxID=202257 RepID=A0A8J6A3X4_GALPY|nr:Lysosomal Pro-X carboxypeptidase [Galemys pyrenaicus]
MRQPQQVVPEDQKWWITLKMATHSNGELDPWSGGGVTEDITDTLIAITIPEGAHHLDLRSNNALDPTAVLLARSLEVRYMQQWIRDFYANSRKKP